jgi:hypothetical protein
VTKTIEKANEALVLEAFDTLFNQRDYKAAGGFGSRAISSTVLTSRGGDVRALPI